MAAQKSWKNTGMLVGIADCGRNQKWGCRGRFAWEFIPRPGSHSGQNHRVLVRVATTQLWVLSLPHSLESRKARCSSDVEFSAVRKNAGEPLWKGKGERTLAGGPGEGEVGFWIKNWRSW